MFLTNWTLKRSLTSVCFDCAVTALVGLDTKSWQAKVLSNLYGIRGFPFVGNVICGVAVCKIWLLMVGSNLVSFKTKKTYSLPFWWNKFVDPLDRASDSLGKKGSMRSCKEASQHFFKQSWIAYTLYCKEHHRWERRVRKHCLPVSNENDLAFHCERTYLASIFCQDQLTSGSENDLKKNTMLYSSMSLELWDPRSEN